METVFFQNDVVEMLNDFYVTDPIKPVVKRGCRVRIGHTGITSMAMTRKPFYRGVFVPIRIPDHR